MAPRSRLVQAFVPGLTAKGLARLDLGPGGRQGLELWGPLPGEQVNIQLGQRKNVWLQETLSVHPQRREPPCLHVGPCGGCTLQQLQDGAQVSLKAERLYARLRSLAPACELLEPIASPQAFGYRTKVEFSFLRDQLGYHRRGCFDRAVDVRHCWIAPPAHRVLLQRTREWQARHGLSGWHPREAAGDLRYLMLRQANPGGNWLAVLVTRTGLEPTIAQDWANHLQGAGPRGLIWVEQSSTASAIVPEREHVLWGEDQITQPLGALQFQLGWRSFFQSNPPAYERLLNVLRLWMEPLSPRRVLDLYCGIGSIGLSVTPVDCAIIGVENVPEAVEDARRCAAQFGRRARYAAQSAESWTDWECDAAIVDPPRSGCHPELVQNLAQHGPAHVFYISCNPERLFGELAHLQAHYDVERAVAVDFFPQTAHMELLVSLRRR